jgi:hypothetical protein
VFLTSRQVTHGTAQNITATQRLGSAVAMISLLALLLSTSLSFAETAVNDLNRACMKILGVSKIRLPVAARWWILAAGETTSMLV